MMDEDYKILISLSHNQLSFDYWQREAGNKVFSFPEGATAMPLAFYVSPITGVAVGEEGERAARSGNENAFTCYFDRLADNITYTVAGQVKEFRSLLLDAIENLLKDFYHKVLYNSKGNLSDNRAKIPLTIIYESDISPNEKALITGMFKDSGYQSMINDYYDSFVAKYLADNFAQQYRCEKVLVAWSEVDDLTFTLFDIKKKIAIAKKTYKGLGVDPRIKIVEEIIWDHIEGQNNWLQKEKQIPYIHKVAKDFLKDTSPLVRGKIILSDNHAYNYSLNRVMIDNIPLEEGTNIRVALNEFLKENNIIKDENLILLLRGIPANNTYFFNNLSYGFSKIVKSDRKLRAQVMKMILDSYVRPEVIKGSIDVPPTIPPYDGNKGGEAPLIPPPIPIQSLSISEKTNIKSLLQRAKKSFDKEEIAEGKKLLKAARDLLGEKTGLPAPTEKLLKEVSDIASKKNEKEVIKKEEKIKKETKPENKPTSHNKTPTKTGRTKKRPTTTEKNDKPPVVKPIVSEGLKYLEQEDYLKAKEVFNQEGNIEMASLCSELNKQSRQFSALSKQLESCKRNKDVSKAKKAIKDISLYIDLRAKVHLEIKNEKSILDKYKSIK